MDLQMTNNYDPKELTRWFGVMGEAVVSLLGNFVWHTLLILCCNKENTY